MIKVSSSSLYTYRRCKRKFLWSREYEPAEPSAALQFGSAFHKAMELLDVRHLHINDAFEGALKEYPLSTMKTLDDGTIALESDTEATELLYAMLRYWSDYWLQAPENRWYQQLETVAAEQEFQLDLGDGVVLTGVIDRVARDPEGRLYVIDYKTSSQFPGDWWVQNNPQFTNYILAAERLLGEPVEYFLTIYFRKANPLKGLRRLKDGSLSKNKSQNVSPLVARKQLEMEGENLEEWSEFATYDPDKDPFVRVLLAHRNKHSVVLAATYLKIFGKALKLPAPETIWLYDPSPQPTCVWECPFTQVCQAFEDGQDWEYLLKDSGLFRRKEVE